MIVGFIANGKSLVGFNSVLAQSSLNYGAWQHRPHPWRLAAGEILAWLQDQPGIHFLVEFEGGFPLSQANSVHTKREGPCSTPQ
jgi:hypothetical protein